MTKDSRSDLERIRGNVASMIEQDAPEADIDEYVASEGYTPEQLRQSTARSPQRFRVTTPDGGSYQIEVPEGLSEQELVNHIDGHLKQVKPEANYARPVRGQVPEAPAPEPVAEQLPAPPQTDPKQPGFDLDAYMKSEEARFQSDLSKAGGGDPNFQGEAPDPYEGGWWTAARLARSLRNGVANVAGAPVDLVNALTVQADAPVMGSDWIKTKLDGLGQLVGPEVPEEAYKPSSDAERYAMAGFRGMGEGLGGEAVVMARGAQLAKRGLNTVRAVQSSSVPASTLAAKVGQTVKGAVDKLATASLERPGVAVATAAASGVGSGVGGQAGRDLDPDSPYGELIGSTLGGLGLGVAAARKMEAATRAPFADSPRPDLDAEIAEDVKRIVEAIPARNAAGKKVPKAVQNATLLERVAALEESYLPRDQVSALSISKSAKAKLKRAMNERHTLSPERLEELSATPEGEAVAEAIAKAQRLRFYIPEGSGAGRSGLNGLAALTLDTAGAALGSKLAGPLGAAGSRLLGRVIEGSAGRPVSDAGAQSARALADQVKRLQRRGGVVSSSKAKEALAKLSAASEEALDRPATESASRAAEQSRMTEAAQRLMARNARDNLRPSGGFRGYLYERTGLLPQEQDQGALRMLQAGDITPEQFNAFLSAPDRLQAGNAGNAMLDRLEAMAGGGDLARDPEWTPPAPPSSSSGSVEGEAIRNPIAYAATAKANQARVSAAIEAVRGDTSLPEPTKEALASALASLANTSKRAEGEAIVTATLEILPKAAKAKAQAILNPILAQLKK